MKLYFALLLLALSTASFANERFWTKAQGQKYGFFPRYYFIQNVPTQEPPLNTPWPVNFDNPQETVAQSYIQYQDYSNAPYYHGGCDLRAKAGSPVTAPIRGKLEAGYYSYERNPNGSKVKLWRPWDGKARPDLYFEIALIHEAGYRYELHHVDPMNLPAPIVKLLNDGLKPGTPPAIIEMGTTVGYVAHWPSGGYHHIHYNIVAPNGLIMNPEFYTVRDHQAPDTIAPSLLGVYGISETHGVIILTEGVTVAAPLRELVVATVDSRDQGIYVQTPAQILARFNVTLGQPVLSGYDWLKALLGPAPMKSQWPDIRATFAETITLPNGKRLVNEGNYGKGLFLIRIPVPRQAAGPFELRIADTYGNFRAFHAILSQ